MKVGYEEKTYESYFNNELDSRSSMYFPPGQVLEGLLGFDAAANSRNRNLWRIVGHPFWFWPYFSGVNLFDIAEKLEAKIETFTNRIPQINANLLLQYKRPVFITSSRGGEWLHWNEPYYRYSIDKEQCDLLNKIEKSFGNQALVLYASPAICSLDELVSAKQNKEIIEKSNFQKPSGLGNHRKNTYTQAGSHSIACSEPEELKNFNLLSELESLDSNHNFSNTQFVINTSQIIEEIMASSTSYKKLISEYAELRKFELIYSFLIMKVFRETTGIQWSLSIKA